MILRRDPTWSQANQLPAVRVAVAPAVITIVAMEMTLTTTTMTILVAAARMTRPVRFHLDHHSG